jgi:expansin (peptidoglycan-binding protein)
MCGVCAPSRDGVHTPGCARQAPDTRPPAMRTTHTQHMCTTGDSYHLDMSNQAFQKIANPGQGVVGVYYRQVRVSRC